MHTSSSTRQPSNGLVSREGRIVRRLERGVKGARLKGQTGGDAVAKRIAVESSVLEKQPILPPILHNAKA